MKMSKVLLHFFISIISALIINSFFYFLIFYILNGDSHYEIASVFRLAISVSFGAFLGISLCIRLMEEKTNYLFLTTVFLAGAIFLFQLSSKSSLSSYSEDFIYIVFSSTVLTTIANLFISKQIKPNQVVKSNTIRPSSKVKQVVRISLMFIVGCVSNFVFSIVLLFSVCVSLAPFFSRGQEEFFLGDCSKFAGPIVIYFGALFGIWVTLKILHEKTNYFYLFIAATILFVIQFFVSSVFSNEIIAQLNGVSIFGVPLILAITASGFMPKQTK